MIKRDVWSSEWDYFCQALSPVGVLPESKTSQLLLLWYCYEPVPKRHKDVKRDMLHSLSEWSFWVLLESDGEVTDFTVNTYDFWIFLNFFECLSTVSFINSIESLKMFFWIWTQRTWTSASDRYSYPVLYFILNIRIHIISGKFRLRSNPRVRFLFSQIFHDERHRSFSMSTLFISSNLSRTLPPHPCFLWLQDVIVPWFTVTSQHHENRVWDLNFLSRGVFFYACVILIFYCALQTRHSGHSI